MKKRITALTVALTYLCLAFFASSVAFASDDESLLVSSVYKVTFSDDGNTVSDIPNNITVNTFLYNIRRENPECIINIFTYNGKVPELYDVISPYCDRRMYISVKASHASQAQIYYLVPKVYTDISDDFEKYPQGLFVTNDIWRYDKNTNNGGYGKIEKDSRSNRYLTSVMPANSDDDYYLSGKNTSPVAFISPKLSLPVNSSAEMNFSLRRIGGSVHIDLRDAYYSSTNHNCRTIYSFSNKLTCFYSGGSTGLNFEDGEWADFKTVLTRDENGKVKSSIYVNKSEEPVASSSMVSSEYNWDEFRVSFGLSPFDSPNSRAEISVDNFSYAVLPKEETLSSQEVNVYSSSDGIEYSGAVRTGENEFKITLKNTSPVSEKITVFAAEKSDGCLLNISAADTDVSGICYLPINLKVDDAVNNDIYIYIWKNGTLYPVSGSPFKLKKSETEAAISNGHPRIVANKDDFDRIRNYSDKTHTEWKNTVTDYAESIIAGFKANNSSFRVDNTESFGTVANRVKLYGAVLGMAYQIEGKKEYADCIYDILTKASAHNGWVDGSFDDLTVSYMLEGYSLAFDWCYDSFSETQRKTIADFVSENCFGFATDEYKNVNHRSHTWSTTYTNHNAIPTSSFITASLAFADYAPDLCQTIFDYSCERIKNFLSGLAPDGAWWEGASYTNLVFAHMAKASESMRINLGKDDLIAGNKFIKRAADFQMAIIGPMGMYNFAEQKLSTDYTIPEMFWLSNVSGRKDVNDWANERVNFTNVNNCVLSLIWADDAENNGTYEFSNYYGRGVEHITLGNGSFGTSSYLSVLGGTNLGQHKHLDLGSFIYDYNGVRWATELGLEDYYDGYHSLKSEEKIFYRSRSEGHNTLEINPSSSSGGQRMNDENGVSEAVVEKYNLRKNKPFAIYDMTSAYLDNSSFVKRGFRLLDDNIGFIVRDEFVTNNSSGNPDSVNWYMHTDAEVSISPDGKSAILSQDGKTMKLTVLEDNLTISYVDAMTPEPILSELLAYSKSKGLGLSKQKSAAYNGKKIKITCTSFGSGSITVMLAPEDKDTPDDFGYELKNWN